MEKNKRTGVIGIIITIIILTTLVIVTNLEAGAFSGAENVFTRIVMPIQNGITSLRNRMERKYSIF
ncbi:MAG: hypothetical protein FWC79_03315 [Oscillospiraceae bacterium]|nr:hypothetical protein [Oscillospiraceae bacterium]